MIVMMLMSLVLLLVQGRRAFRHLRLVFAAAGQQEVSDLLPL